MNHKNRGKHPGTRQRGAALFVALMLLVIVSILGVSVAQVTALQERMANNYRLDDLAFQNADGELRAQELDITRRLSTGRSAACRPDGEGGGSNMIPTWEANAVASDASYESMQNNKGAGRSTGLPGQTEQAVGDIGAGSWQCLMFRVAAVGVAVDDDDASARPILQSTYVME